MSLGTFEFPRYRRIRLTLLILPNTFQNLPIPFSSLSLSPPRPLAPSRPVFSSLRLPFLASLFAARCGSKEIQRAGGLFRWPRAEEEIVEENAEWERERGSRIQMLMKLTRHALIRPLQI